MRRAAATAGLVVSALLLAGCSHQATATFTVWNHTTDAQAGAFRLLQEDGAEVAAFPFSIGAPTNTVTYTTPDHGRFSVDAGTYILWAGVGGNRTLEETHPLGGSLQGISLRIYDDRLEFVLAVT